MQMIPEDLSPYYLQKQHVQHIEKELDAFFHVYFDGLEMLDTKTKLDAFNWLKPKILSALYEKKNHVLKISQVCQELHERYNVLPKEHYFLNLFFDRFGITLVDSNKSLIIVPYVGFPQEEPKPIEELFTQHSFEEFQQFYDDMDAFAAHCTEQLQLDKVCYFDQKKTAELVSSTIRSYMIGSSGGTQDIYNGLGMFPDIVYGEHCSVNSDLDKYFTEDENRDESISDMIFREFVKYFKLDE